jgi:hypothetical protein
MDALFLVEEESEARRAASLASLSSKTCILGLGRGTTRAMIIGIGEPRTGGSSSSGASRSFFNIFLFSGGGDGLGKSLARAEW